MNPLKSLLVVLSLIMLPAFAGPEYDREWPATFKDSPRCKKEKVEKHENKAQAPIESSSNYKEPFIDRERSDRDR